VGIESGSNQAIRAAISQALRLVSDFTQVPIQWDSSLAIATGCAGCLSARQAPGRYDRLNRIGKVVKEHGTIWVARRTETEYFTEVCDFRFEILHAT
jgi:hypothetical protein